MEKLIDYQQKMLAILNGVYGVKARVKQLDWGKDCKGLYLDGKTEFVKLWN
jgi:hypothetical protein